MPRKPLEFLKGTLDLLILRTLSHRPMHGYGVSTSIRDATGAAFQVGDGALYTALRRLEKRGFLEAEWSLTDTGREARFYSLTSEGRTELERELGTWRRYVAAMDQVLEARG